MAKTFDTAIRNRATDIAKGLYPHQVEGIAFLMGRRRSILADDMGLGKTRQSVIAMSQSESRGPYLVICPATVKRNWARLRCGPRFIPCENGKNEGNAAKKNHENAIDLANTGIVLEIANANKNN